MSVGIPQFMLTSTLPVRFALDFLGVDEFREGDVFVANDPYHGGGHLPDYNVFAPVFADDAVSGTRRMVLIASIQCHHGDTGGAVPGGYNVTANDIWGEGVRWPVVKVIDRGEERRDILYALQVNNRLPDYLGDLRAQIGAAQLGARRLGEMVAAQGVATVEQSVDYMTDYAARRFREEVQRVARRHVRGGLLGRPRSARPSRRPPARRGDRRRRPSAHRLHAAPTRAPSCRRGRRSATPAGTRSRRSPR